jgi:hypothetical protein
MLAASTRLTQRFVVTVANCYTGRWSELDVGGAKAQNPSGGRAWRLGISVSERDKREPYIKI